MTKVTAFYNVKKNVNPLTTEQKQVIIKTTRAVGKRSPQIRFQKNSRPNCELGGYFLFLSNDTNLSTREIMLQISMPS